MTGRLEGKSIIVTGASMGIGDAITRRLAAEGARLVLVARNKERLDALASDLPGSTVVVGSVTDPWTAEAAVAAAAGSSGLVNNAGIDLTAELLETSGEDARRIFETNFFGALWMTLAVARDMQTRGLNGSIVNVSSRLATTGVPKKAIYGASKGALDALTRAAAVELAPYGIRVNGVAPGPTATPLLDEWIASQDEPDAFRAYIASRVPQGRLGQPADVAAAVAFLAADEAAHITGATIPVDGGYSAA